jgi:hypothetical protein
MIVKWNGKGLCTFSVNRTKTFTQTKGNSEIASKFAANDIVTLVPGYNEVDDARWMVARPDVLRYIVSGKIEEICREVTNEETGEHELKSYPLVKIRPDAAVEFVKECFNFKTLELWLKGSKTYPPETRDEVRAMIKDQLEAINRGTENAVPTPAQGR